DATRALELLERGPLGVEPVEQLRVHGVRRADASLVGGLRHLARELAGVALVELAEAPRRGRDLPRLVSRRLAEEATTHDLVRLVARRGCPLVGDATHDVVETREGFVAEVAAHFQVGRDGRVVPRG